MFRPNPPAEYQRYKLDISRISRPIVLAIKKVLTAPFSHELRNFGTKRDTATKLRSK